MSTFQHCRSGGGIQRWGKQGKDVLLRAGLHPKEETQGLYVGKCSGLGASPTWQVPQGSHEGTPGPGGIYNVRDRILDTKENGIPHSRRRWYCVGILKSIDDGSFEFPSNIPCADIELFLEKTEFTNGTE